MYGPPGVGGGYGPPPGYQQQGRGHGYPPGPDPGSQPIFTTGIVTVTHQAVMAPNVSVPIPAILGVQSKRGMTGGQVVLGIAAGLLLLGGCGPWSRVFGATDVVGAAMPWVCWAGTVAAVVVGQTLASPYTVTLTTPHGRVPLPPLTKQGAGSVLQAIGVAQGRGWPR